MQSYHAAVMLQSPQAERAGMGVFRNFPWLAQPGGGLLFNGVGWHSPHMGNSEKAQGSQIYLSSA